MFTTIIMVILILFDSTMVVEPNSFINFEDIIIEVFIELNFSF